MNKLHMQQEDEVSRRLYAELDLMVRWCAVMGGAALARGETHSYTNRVKTPTDARGGGRRGDSHSYSLRTYTCRPFDVDDLSIVYQVLYGKIVTNE